MTIVSVQVSTKLSQGGGANYRVVIYDLNMAGLRSVII